MSTGAHPLPHPARRPHRWLVWLLVGLLAAAAIGVGIDRAFFAGHRARLSWPPKPCVVQGIDARCGTFRVPENRAEPNGRTIGLRVVVLPAQLEATASVAVAYLAGGPGDAATEQALAGGWQSSQLHTFRDFLLVDQRGTGRIEAARRRRDPVRDADGDGRPGCGAGGARLPAARRLRRLLRRNRGAGLPEAPSLAGAHAHPLRCLRARRLFLRPLRRQRPARPRPAREALCLGAPAGRRSRAGSASSARS